MSRKGSLVVIHERLFRRQCSFPVSFQRPRDQAVVRVDSFVASARERRFIIRAFQSLLPAFVQLLPFEFDILGNLNTDVDCRG
ncbi:hypothetical protein X747_31805 [Mesorhizobium sp. LNJC384A00]|nr:hypothetical protein X747_31805 [Mesorhizobium sp. LNJC384A00]